MTDPRFFASKTQPELTPQEQEIVGLTTMPDVAPDASYQFNPEAQDPKNADSDGN